MAFEKQLRRVDSGAQWVKRASMVVCLLLLTLVTFVQVAHVHPATANAGNTDQCPICVAMHSAAPVDVAAQAVVLVSSSAPVQVPVVHTVVRPWHCTMFNRPPPSIA